MRDRASFTAEQLAGLTVADPEDVRRSIATAMRFDGRKPPFAAENALANIAAEFLVRHLERAGYVIMRRQPSAGAGAHYSGPLED
jgi:hypothetical protein